MSFKINLIALGLFFTIGLIGFHGKKENENLYNSKNIKVEYLLSRGINKKYLEDFPHWKTNKDYIEYSRNIENREKNIRFTPRKKCNNRENEGLSREIKDMIFDENYAPGCIGIFSEYGLYNVIIKNMEIIKKIDNTPTDKISKENKTLKYMLNKLNEINENYKNPDKRLEGICNHISSTIGSLDKKEEYGGTLDIIQFLNGRYGDCSEISSTYFALLNYFNIKCYIKSGKVHKKFKNDKFLQIWKEDLLHAWICVEINKKEIDLDPTWYPIFAPLNPVGVEKVTLKDKFMQKK